MKKYIDKIIHTIIPHSKNENIPHILRDELIVFISILVAILFYFNQFNFDIIRSLNLSATVYPAVLADLTNDNRLSYGVHKLAWSDTLEQAAKLKAEDMAENSYFAHTSPSGITPWYWLRKVNYNFIYAGENLAVDFTESANVQTAWLNSPTHRANLLNSKFTEIGIATADGVFRGRNTTFVVEFFGQPAGNEVEKKIVANNIAKETINTVNEMTVAGVMTENIIEEELVPDINISIIDQNDEFIIVKNEEFDTIEMPLENNDVKIESFSRWYNRFLIYPTNTIRLIYFVLLILLLLSMFMVLIKEYKKHHTRHLILGLVLVIILFVLLYSISAKTFILLS